MRYIIIITASVLLAACTPAKSGPEKRAYPTQTLTHKAYYYYGLHEVKDRDVIKDIMGVDPVRTQWCAAFVNMILLEQYLPTSESVSSNPLLAQSFLEWGNSVKEPQKGDIVVFKRGAAWQGHVGFYVSTVIDQNGVKYYNIIGGNQSDAVTIEPYAASRTLSIRRLDTSIY